MSTKPNRLLRIAADLANAARDEPIRERFHAWLETQGFMPQVTPKPGSTYVGAHTQTLWECWLTATLAERAEHEDSAWQASVDASGESA